MTKSEIPYITLPQVLVEDSRAKQDIRYYLNHPFLDLSGDTPMLVATNGHVLSAAPVAVSGDVSEGPIPTEAIKAARKVRSKQPEGPKLYFDGDKVGTKAVWFERPAYDFRYPDWRKVVPKIGTKAEHDVAFNVNYIQALSKAHGGTKYGGIKLWLDADKQGAINPNGPIYVKSVEAGAEGFSVLMPMRG